MEVEDLLEFIEGEYHNNYFSSTPRDPEELSYEVYRRCGYSLKNAEKFCQKVKTEISLRHPVVGALKQVIQDRLSEYEIVYLPTFRRIELPIEEEPSNRWKKSTSMKLAKGSFFSAEMNFGLRDVSHRLQEISRKIYVESSLSYREVSADIINDLVSDPNLVNELSGEVPDKDELKLFFDRLGDRKNSRALGVPVKLPDLELMYEKLQFSEENAFLFYFLVKLNGAIRATKLSEERVVGFVDACNKYLGGEDYWKFEDNPQLETWEALNEKFDLSGSEVKWLVLNKQDFSIKVKSLPTGRKVPIESLSSGEKQMISLFSRLFLYEREKIVLIDEPELSLSIDWQRDILPDTLLSPTCRQLIAITHSPFVFDNGLEPFAGSLNVSVSETRPPEEDLFGDTGFDDLDEY